MGGIVEPMKSVFIGEPLRRKIKRCFDKPSISITDYISANIWEGKPEHFTSYA